MSDLCPGARAALDPRLFLVALAGAAAILLVPGAPPLTAQLREVGRGRVGAWRDNVAYGVDIEAGHAYVTGNLGVNIFDVRDAARPRLLARAQIGARAQGIGCRDGLVYFADPQRGLHVVDVSDPAAPRRIATVPATAGAWVVDIVGDRLYLGRHGSGVSVLDIGDPRAPRVLGTYRDGGEAYGVSGDSARIFVADLQQGIEQLDATAPSQVRLATRLPGYAPHAIRLAGRHVYVADQDKGLVIVAADASSPNRTAERQDPAAEYAALVRAHEALPRYADAREVYRHRQRPIVSEGEPHPPYLFHIFEARGTLRAALDFYRRELPALGWRVTEVTERRLRATHLASGFILLLDPSSYFPDRFLERQPPAGVVRWGVSMGGVRMEFR